MKADLDCLPCLVRQATVAVRLATDDERLQRLAVLEAVSQLQRLQPDTCPVELAHRVHTAISVVTRCRDPFRQVKAESNKRALYFYPRAAEVTCAAPDPMLAAAKLAAAGNIADAATESSFDFGAAIGVALSSEFALDDYPALQSELGPASVILYLADNAGEIVFDRLLLEQIGPGRVILAVKERPLLNDATLDDVPSADIWGLEALVTTGNGWVLPHLRGASERFRWAFEHADVIIAKGQANFEALSESDANIYFLLTVKCPVVARDLGAAVGDLVLRKGGKP
jgi:uncharacterized protein with ATP-grasp and redox domains